MDDLAFMHEEEPHQSLEQCKAAQLQALRDKALHRSLHASVVFEDALFQADPASHAAMISALAHPLPASFYWVDQDNRKHPMDAAKLQALSASVFLARFADFDRLQSAKTAVREAQTKSSLFAAPISTALAE